MSIRKSAVSGWCSHRVSINPVIGRDQISILHRFIVRKNYLKILHQDHDGESLFSYNMNTGKCNHTFQSLCAKTDSALPELPNVQRRYRHGIKDSHCGGKSCLSHGAS